jgi:hypothetical protein
MVLERIKAYGHENILCTHDTTIEVTKNRFLTKKGNCILGINATKASKDLNEKLKSHIWEGKKVKVILKTDKFKDSFYGFGHKDLPLNHEEDNVFRKSDFKCNRTVLIKCSKSSKELSQNLINSLKESKKELIIKFYRIEENGR